ncbi:lytic transglycosylase domain-containing protein [Plesiocystis pacifica]|uniref:lytic transglycosylase domain-containing protein n=1 Tax=Plesiocystis pacifica TaxID=191768 RepID=UPI0012F7F982|nr:lytic transglycosylase domain-containing protein [Plesiocystis pacifica]
MTRSEQTGGDAAAKVGLLSTSTLLALGLASSLVVGAAGCHAESPPALSMAESSSVGTVETRPIEDEEPSDEAPAAEGERALWFADGPGRDAILARERRDHEGAIAHLDVLLADPELAADDRAAAELLHAYEDLRRDDWTLAAERLAKARTSPALAPIEAHLRVVEAQARLDAQDSEGALELVRDLDPRSKAGQEAGVPARALMVKADALSRTMARDEAIAAYRAYLELAEGRRVHEARRKLAVLLLGGEAEDQRAAAELFERLSVDVPLSSYAEEARSELAKLERTKVVERSKAESKSLDRQRKLAEIDAHLSKRSYAETITAADRFIKQARGLGASEGDRCRALYAKGSAIFKQRKRPAAQPVFDQASKHCKKAGDEVREVKSRYQAARGRYSAGKYSDAGTRFEALAKDHPDHSYADDAWIKAGESWESAGKAEEARKAYESSLAKHPDGDMADEALRRLLVQAFAEGREADVVRLADEAIAGGRIHGDALAKLHYFRGKALERTGEGAEAEAAYLRAIDTRPLSYPSLQALSRLRERGEEAEAKGLARLTEASAQPLPELALPSSPAAERVRVWARLGLGEEAKAELSQAGIKGWPAVAALAQAGLYNEAQKLLASQGSSWRRNAATGDYRALWELAHPVPFRALVGPGEEARGVPELLTYAVMQTESRFNPGATSWAGARGLIQLMPGTAETVARRIGVQVQPSELYDPATNLELGQHYLAGLVGRWEAREGSEAQVALAIPSYNAGPGRTDQWLKERGSWDLDLFVEAIPFDETRHYTQSVLGRWAAYRWIYGAGEAGERMPYLPLTIPPRSK